MTVRWLAALGAPVLAGCIPPCAEAGYGFVEVVLDARVGEADAYLPDGRYRITVETSDDVERCTFEVVSRDTGAGLVGRVRDSTCVDLSWSHLDFGEKVRVRSLGFFAPTVDPSEDSAVVRVQIDEVERFDERQPLRWLNNVEDIRFGGRCRSIYSPDNLWAVLDVDESLAELAR